MDIYDYLKQDHLKVDNLFKEFAKTDNVIYKTEISEMLIKELLIHAQSEEQTFYKKLEEYAAYKKDIHHSEKEHKEIEDQIQKIISSQVPSKEFDNNIAILKKLVKHHVKEEENKIFSEAKKVLSKTEANILKEKMHYAKEKLLRAFQAPHLAKELMHKE